MARTWFATTLTALSLAASGTIASATEIKVFCPIAMKGVMPDIVAQFEASGQKVLIEYGTVGALAGQLRKDASADVAILSGPRIEELEKEGKIVAGSRADVARVGVGVFVRAGAAKPNIVTVDALKETLQTAKAISYGDPAGGGVSGVHMASLVDRLGIGETLKPKTKLLADSQAVLTAVAKGDIEIGIGLTSDTALIPGVDLAGALPTEIQHFTLYAAGLASSGKETAAGKALIKFLSSQASQAIFKAKGFEPL